ncbi:hypothetical protein F8388_020005 [Cannabis sativa]|uniref:Uncharacterized protein n=1 Tax=Cannabis sativa TaxID=3483 RepID=A0A7J6GUG2_CANSA|nr:hypothetical protein F8388_020005 [Cannabis sativa]
MVLNLLCYMSEGIATGEACEERDRRRFHLSIRSQPPRRPKKRPRNIQRQLHFINFDTVNTAINNQSINLSSVHVQYKFEKEED